MEITEVRIKLMSDTEDRLQAFCSITFDDCFVVRDLKIIEGGSGPFVAMPSRKLTTHCPKCRTKNHLRAFYCNQCGLRLRDERSPREQQEGRCKLYADIAHPINSACREMIQERVIREFQAEMQRSREPGYMSRYDEDYGPDEGPDDDFEEQQTPSRQQSRADRAQVQPPEKQPRPPHKPISSNKEKEGASNDRRDQRGNSEFGAGIF